MSTYYKINGLKVRVSDHEPNFSMDRFRGHNDVEFYTFNPIENKKMSVIEQIENYCCKHDLDVELFAKIAKDFPDEEYVPVSRPQKIGVTEEFIKGYNAISGKGSSKKKDKYCEQYGVDAYKISQGYYDIKNNY